MKDDISLFQFENFEVRLIKDQNEGLWFICFEVCEVLGISEKNIGRSLAQIPNEWKSTFNLKGKQGHREIRVINESALYKLAFRSNNEKADKFTNWVANEVLPSIRKTGSYSVQEFKLPNNYIEALEALVVSEKEKLSLQSKVEVLEPKGIFYDRTMDSTDTIDMGEVAKVINIKLKEKNRKSIGRNSLFQFLRQKKILQVNNQPYQTYIDSGWFKLITQVYEHNKENKINLKTEVYQKGVDGILKLILAAQI